MTDNIVLKFFIDNFPTARQILLGGPLSLLWAFSALAFAGYLKRYRGFKTGYTRKIFHFLIFFSASFIHLNWGLPALCLFGAATSFVVFYSLFRGQGDLMYEALAREKDAPHGTYYIIIPYIATLFGGLTANIFFGTFAIAGYLVTGLADAIAEPVGTRWGKHTYRVPAFRQVAAIRSIEGSFAVFVASFLSLLLALGIISTEPLLPQSMLMVLGISVVCTLTEAFSPHGWDNFTLQIAPAFLLSLFI